MCVLKIKLVQLFVIQYKYYFCKREPKKLNTKVKIIELNVELDNKIVTLSYKTFIFGSMNYNTSNFANNTFVICVKYNVYNIKQSNKKEIVVFVHY